ncbi:MAG: DUF1573 domain-containing protein [Muribaculaceae bacterium]|nr:DUF1573 domain-containing protein [Muribaculaceae bacterium]MDE6866758.1 DUF1573 domain-containing protein [Muribaculaceae bacterium]
MKKYLKYLLALGAVILFLLPMTAKGKEKAEIAFAEKTHNFGIVKEDGGPVSYDFQFVNDGKGNLIIYDATAQCGCTRPEYPKNPVAPGKNGKIRVTYNPIGRPGPFEKVVTVRSNAREGKVRLKISGNVTPKNK